MANTYVDYTATAAQTDFAFSFPYLEDSHVVVEIDGVVKTLTTHYTIVTSPSKKIVLTSGATAGQIVRVRRDSDADSSDPFVDFTNGSVLTEAELDKSYLHNLYLNEEIGELNEQSLQKQAGGTDWDAKSLKIVNLATGTNANDAANKTYVDGLVNEATLGLGGVPVKQVFTGNASDTTFTFSSSIDLEAPTAYSVAIDGVLQEPTVAYTLNTTANTITFSSPPANLSKIVIVPRGYAVPIGAGSTVAGNVTVSGNVTAVDLTASGDVAVGDDLTVTDDGSVGGDLTVTGKVGIGATPSAKKLEITTTGSTDGLKIIPSTGSGSILIHEGAAGAAGFQMKTSTDTNSVVLSSDSNANYILHGNTGLGTTTPTAPLDIVKTVSGFDIDGHMSIQNENGTDGDYAGISFSTHTNTGDGNLKSFIGARQGAETHGRHDFVIIVDANADDNAAATGDEKVRITHDGKVGINNVAPAEALDVTGNAKVSGTLQVGGFTVPKKYASGWASTHGSVAVANGSTHTITHNLGTTDVSVKIYVSAASGGTNAQEVNGVSSASGSNRGAVITNLTANTCTVQLLSSGYLDVDSSGVPTTTAFGSVGVSEYLNIVVIG